MVFHHLPTNHIIGQFGGGGGGVQAYHFGKNNIDLLRVVLSPCVQYYPCEASEQKMGPRTKV